MRHVGRRIYPRRGLQLAGLSRGFGGAFDLSFTVDPGGVPVSQSVQTSEMAVTGTFAAKAPTLLDQAAQYQAGGLVQPSVTYSDGTVITADGRQSKAPEGWSPDPRTWGSPMDAVNGATRTASNADQSAIDNQLAPGVTPGPSGTNEAVDGSWRVGPDGTVHVVDEAGGMRAPTAGGGWKWWHYALLGGAVLGGVALVRAVVR